MQIIDTVADRQEVLIGEANADEAELLTAKSHVIQGEVHRGLVKVGELPAELPILTRQGELLVVYLDTEGRLCNKLPGCCVFVVIRQGREKHLARLVPSQDQFIMLSGC